MSNASNEIYSILSLTNPATPPVRLVNGKATFFAAGLWNGSTYDPLPHDVLFQVRPYFNFDGSPWTNVNAGWFTVHTQTANGFAATIYLGGEWQVRAVIGPVWASGSQAGVSIGASVESK
jgi:hypothetical protein